MNYSTDDFSFTVSRFVLNVPEEDQQSFERILFLVEYAYWYYEDNAVENDPTLKSLSLKEFTSLCIPFSLFQFYADDDLCLKIV